MVEFCAGFIAGVLLMKDEINKLLDSFDFESEQNSNDD